VIRVEVRRALRRRELIEFHHTVRADARIGHLDFARAVFLRPIA
jgi:hypothetical protein